MTQGPTFEDSYWNCAQPELTAPGYLKGDEAVRVWGMHPDGDLAFALPGHYVYALFRYTSGVMMPFPMMLDTVTIDADEGEVALVWRITAPLAPDVRVVEIGADLGRARGA